MYVVTASTLPQIFLLIAIPTVKAEESLSWFTKDVEIRKSMFVPDNLSDGKEETRLLPWVFFDDDKTKMMQLKCIMRGYNATNNPSDYMDARWSYPGFDDNQVNTNIPPVEGNTEEGVPYKIWTIEIKTSAAASGKKWATCEFQQGDFPLSIDFTFLIFKMVSEEKLNISQALLSFGLGESLDEKDLTQKIKKNIKGQISEHYKDKSSSNVTRSGDLFLIQVQSKPEVELFGVQIFFIIFLVLTMSGVIAWAAFMAHKDENFKINFGFVECGLCWAMLCFSCGCKSLVRLFLERNKDNIERTDKQGRTPLMEASMEGHPEMVALLIEHEANVEIQDSEGSTPLIIAAQKGHTQTVKILIEKGAKQLSDSNGCSPLMLAAHGGHTDIVKILFEHGADVNGKSKNLYTAVMWAASAGHTETVKVLCENKADLNSKDEQNNTAAMIAANSGHPETEKVISEFCKKSGS